MPGGLSSVRFECGRFTCGRVFSHLLARGSLRRVRSRIVHPGFSSCRPRLRPRCPPGLSGSVSQLSLPGVLPSLHARALACIALRYPPGAARAAVRLLSLVGVSSAPFRRAQAAMTLAKFFSRCPDVVEKTGAYRVKTVELFYHRLSTQPFVRSTDSLTHQPIPLQQAAAG
jgi:hypothetical protein